MPTTEIPREQWTSYLRSFSASNQTRPVNIDFESNELGPNRLVEDRPLLAVEAETRGDEASITLVAGDPDGAEPAALTHEIPGPQAVWIKADDQGQAEALDIESPDGRIIVQFTKRVADST